MRPNVPLSSAAAIGTRIRGITTFFLTNAIYIHTWKQVTTNIPCPKTEKKLNYACRSGPANGSRTQNAEFNKQLQKQVTHGFTCPAYTSSQDVFLQSHDDFEPERYPFRLHYLLLFQNMFSSAAVSSVSSPTLSFTFSHHLYHFQPGNNLSPPNNPPVDSCTFIWLQCLKLFTVQFSGFL